MALSQNLLTFINQLPDPIAAEGFVVRLFDDYPARAKVWERDALFFSNLLTLAAYSPWLAETMLQQPDYIDWLKRERNFQLIKPKEQLLEELSKFAGRHSSITEQVMLARFKRRELLRIYLRDCLRAATLIELTEELSNLADSLLQYALNICYQRLTNKFGLPHVLDARGRKGTAEFAIIAMGKLGSCELNYASDIDIMFLYSEEGTTAGNGVDTDSSISNREFFIKLSESIMQLVGQPGGEGAVYRVDLRLRPNGTLGLLAYSLAETIRYYQITAKNWERQALIKTRTAAGSESLVAGFLKTMSPLIYRQESPATAIGEVRAAKDKMDGHYKKPGKDERYNVKLGGGGIREIEFTVQALQLAYGGRDRWLRSPQTLIGLQRLADKGLITDHERTQLSDAYVFLRTVEHRLQMEHGVQTHSLPSSRESLTVLARRMKLNQRSISSEHDYDQFMENLKFHRENVSRIYERVFNNATNGLETPNGADAFQFNSKPTPPTIETITADSAADIIRELSSTGIADISTETVLGYLMETRNPARTLKNLRSFVSSLSTYIGGDKTPHLGDEQIRKLIPVLGSGQFFAQMLINRPTLAVAIPSKDEQLMTLDNATMLPAVSRYRQALRACLDGDDTDMAAVMGTHRKVWHEEFLKVGIDDIVGKADLVAVNRAQTALALASIEEATDFAIAEHNRRYQIEKMPSSFAVLGLGRIAHWGMDYGSDLDLLFVYEDCPERDALPITIQQYFSELAELTVHLLATVTRAGYLYSVDMRLRPNGSKGLLAQSSSFMLDYLNKHAAAWEHLAYVRACHVAGDAEFGQAIQSQIIDACMKGSKDTTALAEAVTKIRSRTIKEHSRKSRELNIRFGLGATMDVYFISRFLQLKHGIGNPETPGTLPLIRHLNSMNVLSDESAELLYEGYKFLRHVDHGLRLMNERAVRTLPQSEALLEELAAGVGVNGAEVFLNKYRSITGEIARLFDLLVR